MSAGVDAGSALVSVVIPTYNYAHFLGQAIESVRNQTLGEWQCIVIDDGSTDGTADLVGSLAAGDRRILPRHQPNRGLAAARNAGLALAGGRYVQFLDADDLLAPDKLARQVDVLEADPGVGVSYSGYQRFRSETGEAQGRYADLALGDDPLRDFLYRWQRGFSIPLHCALFRRDLWPGGVAFDKRLRSKEDWLMWIDLALRGVRFQLLDADLAWYRAHRGNMTVDRLEMLLAFARAAELVVSRLPEAERERFVGATTDYMGRAVGDYLARAAERPADGVSTRPVRVRPGRAASDRAGRISAVPNPLIVGDGSGMGSVTLVWEVAEDDVQIHVGAPAGPLVAQASGSSQVTTGNWVRDGTAFFLQDTSGGAPLTEENTIAIEVVHVIGPSPLG